MHCNWLVELDQATIEERLQCADLIIGPSEHVSERIRARFPQVAGRCRTLFNGVDLGLFSPRTDQARPDVAPRIVYVGRISPEKGVHVLMDAFERVLRTLPDAHLDLYGAISQLRYNFCAGLSDEPQVRALKRYYRGGPLNKLGMARARARYMIEMQQRHPAVVGRKAIFHGSEPHPALADAYRNAAVVVFPSVCYEGFGMAIAEAMASEVPVVAARAGGITDLVERVGAGVLVDRDDADGMAAAILHLLNDPDRRRDMAARGRQFAIRELAWDQLTRQLEGHYEDLLAPAPR
jgi:glycosyltransferase involved in cell wall biosynthesis